MAHILQDGQALEYAALWQVDLVDIAKQLDLPTNVLLDAFTINAAPQDDSGSGALQSHIT
jgi:hypothetical protein